jgi:hypothetical protein
MAALFDISATELLGQRCILANTPRIRSLRVPEAKTNVRRSQTVQGRREGSRQAEQESLVLWLRYSSNLRHYSLGFLALSNDDVER